MEASCCALDGMLPVSISEEKIEQNQRHVQNKIIWIYLSSWPNGWTMTAVYGYKGRGQVLHRNLRDFFYLHLEIKTWAKWIPFQWFELKRALKEATNHILLIEILHGGVYINMTIIITRELQT